MCWKWALVVVSHSQGSKCRPRRDERYCVVKAQKDICVGATFLVHLSILCSVPRREVRTNFSLWFHLQEFIIAQCGIIVGFVEAIEVLYIVCLRWRKVHIYPLVSKLLCRWGKSVAYSVVGGGSMLCVCEVACEGPPCRGY